MKLLLCSALALAGCEPPPGPSSSAVSAESQSGLRAFADGGRVFVVQQGATIAETYIDVNPRFGAPKAIIFTKAGDGFVLMYDDGQRGFMHPIMIRDGTLVPGLLRDSSDGAFEWLTEKLEAYYRTIPLVVDLAAKAERISPGYPFIRRYACMIARQLMGMEDR